MARRFGATVVIDRPIAEVFALLADGENDPKLSARVIEIATTRGRMMIRFALTLLVAVGVAALPASAAALAPGTLSPLACVVDNDPPADQSACARSGDALDGLDDIAISPDGRNVYAPASSADALHPPGSCRGRVARVRGLHRGQRHRLG